MGKKGDVNYKSFSLRTFYVFLWDLLFLILLSIGFIQIAKMSSNFAKKNMAMVDLANIVSTNVEIANANYAALKMVLFWVIFWIVSFFIAYLILLTIFKGALWLKLNGKKVSWKILMKYFIMNVIYFVPMVIISIWLYLEKMFKWLFFVIIIFFYIYTVSCYCLSKKEKLKEALKFTFTKGFNWKLILKYISFAVVFFVLNYLFSMWSFPSKIIFNAFFYTIYFAIFKVCMNNAFGRVLK